MIVPFGDKEAVAAGDILAALRFKGESIGIEDVLIASTAIMNKYIMVTANTRHFLRIKGLTVENWLEEE